MHVLTVRLSDEEYEDVQAKAVHWRCSMSEVMRRALRVLEEEGGLRPGYEVECWRWRRFR